MTKRIEVTEDFQKELTGLYNQVVFRAIKKHYPANTSKNAFPLIGLACKAMKTGRNLVNSDFISAIKDDDLSRYLEQVTEDTKEIAEKFLIEQEKLIKGLSDTYRKPKKMIDFIEDCIVEGIKFELTLILKLMEKDQGAA